MAYRWLTYPALGLAGLGAWQAGGDDIAKANLPGLQPAAGQTIETAANTQEGIGNTIAGTVTSFMTGASNLKQYNNYVDELNSSLQKNNINQILDSEVYDLNGEKLGKISDILVDPQNFQAQWMIVAPDEAALSEEDKGQFYRPAAIRFSQSQTMDENGNMTLNVSGDEAARSAYDAPQAGGMSHALVSLRNMRNAKVSYKGQNVGEVATFFFSGGQVSHIAYEMAHPLENHPKYFLIGRDIFSIDPISFGNNPLTVALTLEKKIASR